MAEKLPTGTEGAQPVRKPADVTPLPRVEPHKHRPRKAVLAAAAVTTVAGAGFIAQDQFGGNSSTKSTTPESTAVINPGSTISKPLTTETTIVIPSTVATPSTAPTPSTEVPTTQAPETTKPVETTINQTAELQTQLETVKSQIEAAFKKDANVSDYQKRLSDGQTLYTLNRGDWVFPITPDLEQNDNSYNIGKTTFTAEPGLFFTNLIPVDKNSGYGTNWITFENIGVREIQIDQNGKKAIVVYAKIFAPNISDHQYILPFTAAIQGDSDSFTWKGFTNEPNFYVLEQPTIRPDGKKAYEESFQNEPGTVQTKKVTYEELLNELRDNVGKPMQAGIFVTENQDSIKKNRIMTVGQFEFQTGIASSIRDGKFDIFMEQAAKKGLVISENSFKNFSEAPNVSDVNSLFNFAPAVEVTVFQDIKSIG